MDHFNFGGDCTLCGKLFWGIDACKSYVQEHNEDRSEGWQSRWIDVDEDCCGTGGYDISYMEEMVEACEGTYTLANYLQRDFVSSIASKKSQCKDHAKYAAANTLTLTAGVGVGATLVGIFLA